MKNIKKKMLLVLMSIMMMGFIYGCAQTNEIGYYDTFAKALTEKGVKMYGTEWCPHCKNQKELFGASFQHINYIDCDKNQKICIQAGVKGYPTWEINNELYPGEQTMEELAELSGVELTFDLEDSET